MILTDNGAWCWFSDPRAVYFEGAYKRTYTGWVDSIGSIVVGSYDHETLEIETDTLHWKLEKDDHNNPSFLINSDGRLMVFYSKHSKQSPIYLVRSKTPENIHQWEAPRSLALNDSSLFREASNTYTYTNIVRLSNENDKLYLFWRGVDFKPNFSTSTDGGNTWSPGKILILPARIYRNRRPYLKVSANNRDIIHFAFTDGHPRNEPTNSIYYAKYMSDTLYRADGKPILPWSELPMEPSNSDLVYDATSTGEKAWIWDVAGDSEDNPVVVYSHFENDSTHLYYYARWHNNQWQNIKLADSGGWFPHTLPGETEREPNYSGGLALDHSDPSIVYLSIEKNGIFEIEKWQYQDTGSTWTKSEITANSEFDNIRPFVVRKPARNGPEMVLWMNIRNYVHYTQYDSSIKLSIN